MAALLMAAMPALLARLGQHILQLDAVLARIGLRGERQLLCDDFTDIEKVSGQRFGRCQVSCTLAGLLRGRSAFQRGVVALL